jgi:hypothetical protein
MNQLRFNKGLRGLVGQFQLLGQGISPVERSNLLLLLGGKALQAGTTHFTIQYIVVATLEYADSELAPIG